MGVSLSALPDYDHISLPKVPEEADVGLESSSSPENRHSTEACDVQQNSVPSDSMGSTIPGSLEDDQVAPTEDPGETDVGLGSTNTSSSPEKRLLNPYPMGVCNVQQNSVSSGSMGSTTPGSLEYDHVAPKVQGEADVCLESTNTPRSPANFLQHPMGTSDAWVPDGDVAQVPQHDLPLTTGRGQIGSAYSEPTHFSTTERPSVAEDRKEAIDGHTPNVPNVIVLGETGVGKSSIINLIAGQKLAHTSNGALGCTFLHRRYRITLDKMTCAFWDTTGLDEGSEGTVPSRQAEDNLRDLMRGLERSGGIHLIIYCIRGSRLTKALKRNYDLFYVTVCRKKVPVALVVTGLEYQQDEMETWWTANEVTLRHNGMRFDAHACVTTLDGKDRVLQQRRSDSRTLLRKLVVRYSQSTAWKTDPSFISWVLPAFQSVFRGTSSSTGNLGDSTTLRNVTFCDPFTEFLPGTTAILDKSTGRIGNRQCEFLRVDKHVLDKLTSRTSEDGGGMSAGVLIFYTSPLVDNLIPLTDVNVLKMFYDYAGGQICPMIVVLRGCDDEKVAQSCSVQVESRHSDIRAHFVSLPSTDDARVTLDDMIERLCIEQPQAEAEVKTRKFFRRHIAGNRFLAPIVNAPFQ